MSAYDSGHQNSHAVDGCKRMFARTDGARVVRALNSVYVLSSRSAEARHPSYATKCVHDVVELGSARISFETRMLPRNTNYHARLRP